VRFITFNYDRSLEFFLHESTKGTYVLNDGAAYNNWSRLQVMHVYGSVGDFDFANPANPPRPYSTEINPRTLGAAAGGITIIPEGRDEASVFKTARKWFDWAQHVYILGFGFDRLNCERLGFWSVLEADRPINKKLPAIVATVVGLTPVEVTRARQYLLKKGDWSAYDKNNARTLRLVGLPD
jgi:hypothetical protein